MICDVFSSCAFEMMCVHVCMCAWKFALIERQRRCVLFDFGSVDGRSSVKHNVDFESSNSRTIRSASNNEIVFFENGQTVDCLRWAVRTFVVLILSVRGIC